MLKKKSVLLSVLVCGVLIIQNARAAPWQDGSIHSGQSSRIIDVDGGSLAVSIDFAVFDTVANPDAWGGENGFDIPGGGQYVYAYQIFNEEGLSSEALGSFSLLKQTGEALDEAPIMGTGWENDMTGEDIAPEDIPTASSWAFNGFFIPGKYSSFLVISSDQSWVEGDYNLDAYEEPVFSVPDNVGEFVVSPEPATVTLLGIGSLLILKNKKK